MTHPRHVAIIMDGNGRWAQSRGHARFFGHVRGATVARKVIEDCAQRKIPNLTLFTFSSENWSRPGVEVSFLMNLLMKRLIKETPTLLKNNIRFYCIGDIHRLPKRVQQTVRQTIMQTSGCTGMNLTFALSYGGRQELTGTMRKLAQQVQAGELSPEQITESLLAANLESAFLPDPDLIIRTSGESRLSNFFLWQAAYSEIYVCNKAWPDFDSSELDLAMREFASRERRFGRTREQIEETLTALPSAGR